MTQRRTRRSVRRSRPRRAVEWFDTNIITTLPSGTLKTFDLSAQVVDDEKKGMTVVRVIVDLVAQLSAVGTGGLVSMGIAMVAKEAGVAGAFPEVTDQEMEASWMWKRPNLTVSATNLNDQSTFTRFAYDTRVMRKFRFQDNELRLILESGVLTSTVNVNGIVRMLGMKS